MKDDGASRGCLWPWILIGFTMIAVGSLWYLFSVHKPTTDARSSLLVINAPTVRDCHCPMAAVVVLPRSCYVHDVWSETIIKRCLVSVDHVHLNNHILLRSFRRTFSFAGLV